jgi:hypothetical protein
MNTNVTRIILTAASIIVAGSVAAQQPEAPVRITTEGLPTHMRDRLEQKAQEGPTALIRYVNRTRMMGYQIRVEDIVVTPEDLARMAAAAKAEAVLARSDEPEKK